MSSHIVLASNNTGKLAEFSSILDAYNINITPQSHYAVPDIDEPYTTFLENALHKARHCAMHTKLPSLADDSGLCVNALNKAPGVYSARYAFIDTKHNLDTNSAEYAAINYNKLLKDLHGFSDRSAYFYCVLVFVRHKDDPEPIVASGKLLGEITHQPSGTNGFGYNPIFCPSGYQETLATLDIASNINHRYIALQNFLKQYSSL